MNVKMKLAALAAVAAFAAPVFATEVISDYTAVAGAEMSVEGAAVLAAEASHASTVFDGFAFDDTGNAALVYQTGTISLAYVEQSDTAAGNYAYISQASSDKADVAAVFQSGTNNRAVVNQY